MQGYSKRTTQFYSAMIMERKEFSLIGREKPRGDECYIKKSVPFLIFVDKHPLPLDNGNASKIKITAHLVKK